MDFYNYKLQKYDELGNIHMIDRMIRAKSKIEETNQTEYNLLQKAFHSLVPPITGTFPDELVFSTGVPVSKYHTAISAAKEKMDFVKSQSPKDYFLSLTEQEEISINNYVDNKIVTQIDKIMQLRKLNSEKGLDTKFDGLLGRIDTKKTQLSNEISTLDDQIEVGQEARSSWAHLTETQKLDYVVSRYEADGTTEFDEKAVDEFVIIKQQLEQQAAEEEAANASQRQSNEEFEALFQQ